MYIDILTRWNARVNLTAIRNPEEIVTRHFGESLFLARHLFPPNGRAGGESHPSTNVLTGTVGAPPFQSTGGRIRVLDIGSGAGFPGVPLKIWAPDIRLTLAESNHKKAAFLRELIRALRFTDINVFAARAETLLAADHSGPSSSDAAAAHQEIHCDVVTFRAVERFETILPVAAKLVAPNGCLAMLVGSSQISSLESRLETKLPRFQTLSPIPVPCSESRVVQFLVRLP